MEFQNLHYLMYVVDWYSSLSNDTVLSQPLGNEMMLPNSAVPSGPPVSWPSPRLGTKGPGFPDIANQSQHLIWEVKTGGGFGGAMGTRWPDDDYVIRGSAQAAWYAARARYLKDNRWQVGNTTAGTPGYDAAVDNFFRTSPDYTGAGGTCTIRYLDGTVLEIRIPTNVGGTPVSGVITYRVTHERDTPIPVPIALTQPLLPIIPVPIVLEWPGGSDQPKKPESTDPFLGLQTSILSLTLNLSGFGFGPSPSPGPVIGTGPMYRCRCF